jgi:cephalosporin hydroxylase
MGPIEEFEQEKSARIDACRANTTLQALGKSFVIEAIRAQYAYNFTWMGRPIIQFPQDIVAMQEVIWSVKPDLIIETGVAHGGSLVFSASMLQLLNGDGIVLGIDVDVRSHNRALIESHPLAHRIRMIKGSSTDPRVLCEVRELAATRSRILVALDSNHAHAHVLEELRLYAPLVSLGSYLVVFDTIVEEMPDELSAERPWKRGNSPKTAVHEFLATHPEFEIDTGLEAKLFVSVAPDGYLRRVRQDRTGDRDKPSNRPNKTGSPDR